MKDDFSLYNNGQLPARRKGWDDVELLDQAQAMGGALKALKDELHRHPELSFQERRTTALLQEKLTQLGLEPNYLIIVDRKNNLDTMEVQVEMNPSLFSDTVKDIENAEKRIEAALQSR